MKNKAFTLLELLVVIGIIGVMMALATVAYSTTQRSGRDARRKQDLVAMQNALEQYYSANSFTYPNPNCIDADVYTKTPWPVDPINDATYTYIKSCTGTTYCLCSRMEVPTAGNAKGTVCADADWSKNDLYYCVSSLQ